MVGAFEALHMKVAGSLSILFIAGLAGTFLVSTCGGLAARGPDPLLGTWTANGTTGASFVKVSLTFKSDGSFRFVENVAPTLGGPDAGVRSNSGCVVTDTYDGTYSEITSDSTHVLTMNFASGTANQVSGCTDNPAWNSAGTSMTPDGIVDRQARGYIPPEMVNYTVTSTTLLISTPNDEGIGIGRGAGTTFVRSP